MRFFCLDRLICLLVVFLLSPGYTSASEKDTVVAGAAADSIAADYDSLPNRETEDLAETLDELQQAGVEPTPEDWQRFQYESVKKNESSGGLLGLLGKSNKIAVRTTNGSTGSSLLAKMKARGKYWQLKLKYRQHSEQENQQAFGFNIGPQNGKLWVGTVGLSHGCGILVSAPGRSKSLSAGSTFNSRKSGPVMWTGSADKRTVAGVVLDSTLHGWRTLFITGKIADRPEDTNSGPVCFRIGRDDPAFRWGLLAVRTRTETGGSFAGNLQLRSWYLAWEGAVWQPQNGILTEQGWQIHLKWKKGRNLLFEGLVNGSTSVAGNAMGSKPAGLSGYNGKSWALRGVFRPSGKIVTRVMLSNSEDRPVGKSSQVKAGNIVDLQASWNAGSGRSITLRHRSKSTLAHSWSERYPWQIDSLNTATTRSVTSFQIGKKSTQWSGYFMARVANFVGTSTEGKRSLAQLTGKWQLNSAVNLRGSWTTAWGDPVDLVSAVCPVPGTVLPRHWGKWRSENVLGVEVSPSNWKLQAAVSVRTADTGSRPTEDISGWLAVEKRF